MRALRDLQPGRMFCSCSCNVLSVNWVLGCFWMSVSFVFMQCVCVYGVLGFFCVFCRYSSFVAFPVLQTLCMCGTNPPLWANNDSLYSIIQKDT